MSSIIPEEYIYGKENRKNGVNVSVAVQIIFCYYIKWKNESSLEARATGPEGVSVQLTLLELVWQGLTRRS